MYLSYLTFPRFLIRSKISKSTSDIPICKRGSIFYLLEVLEVLPPRQIKKYGLTLPTIRKTYRKTYRNTYVRCKHLTETTIKVQLF